MYNNCAFTILIRKATQSILATIFARVLSAAHAALKRKKRRFALPYQLCPTPAFFKIEKSLLTLTFSDNQIEYSDREAHSYHIFSYLHLTLCY